MSRHILCRSFLALSVLGVAIVLGLEMVSYFGRPNVVAVPKCEFNWSLNHYTSCGWHGRYSGLGAQQNHTVCLLLVRGTLFSAWMTVETATAKAARGQGMDSGFGLAGCEVRWYDGMQGKGDDASRFVVRYVNMKLWIALMLFGAYPAWTVVRCVGQRRRRKKDGFCTKCGYDLTGNVSGTCPECGSAAPKSRQQ